MKHNLSVLALLLPALVLVSCMRQPDTEGFRKTVDEMNAISMEVMKTGESEKVLVYYAEDAVSLPPNMEPLLGKTAIENWMKQMNQSGMKVTKASFSTRDYGIGGTVAYEYGTYDMSMEMPGMGVVSDKGNYMSIWAQQEDGSWKIKAETWNSTNPLPGMEMPK